MPLDRREFTLAAASILTAESAAARGAGPTIIALTGTNGDASAVTRNDLFDAIQAGADYLETNLLQSADGALVAAGDRDLAVFTNVATQSAFADRRTTKHMLGAPKSTWYLEDFTLDELREIAVVTPGRRDHRGGGSMLSLDDVIDFAKAASARMAKVVGVCVGFNQRNDTADAVTPIEVRLAETIRTAGYNSPAAAMIVQSTDFTALKNLRGLCRTRLLHRLRANGGRLDEIASESGLNAIRTYADGVAPDIDLLGMGSTTEPVGIPLEQRCRAAGLSVYAWAPTSTRLPQDFEKRLAQMFKSGLDGVATNAPQAAARARRAAVGS